MVEINSTLVILLRPLRGRVFGVLADFFPMKIVAGELTWPVEVTARRPPLPGVADLVCGNKRQHAGLFRFIQHR